MGQLPQPVAVTDVLEDVRLFLSKLKDDMPEVFKARYKAPPKEKVVVAPMGRTASTIPFQGGTIDLLPVAEGRISGIVEVDGGVHLELAEDESTEATVFLQEWYLKKAWQALRAASERWSAVMGLKFGQIRVKDQKTLWGSCSRDGNLAFNWRLILAPQHVLEYVVIHELAHLKEMNHSKAFWAIVASACPDYEQRRDWLRVNDKQLRWDPRSAELDHG